MRKDLVEKVNDLMKKADDMLNKAKLEKRELTPDEMQELAEIRDDVMRIKKALGLEKEFDDMRELETKADATPTEGGDRACGTDDKKRSVEEAAKAAAEERAFEAYIRGTALNQRDDVNLTPANNGAVIPKTIANKIIKKVYDICPILEKSSKYNMKGTLDIPFYPASADTVITVAYHDEFEELTSTNGNFNKITLTGFLAGALSKVSRSLINNAAFDIVGFVVDEMAYAIKRFIEKELLIGTPGNGSTIPAKVLGLSTLTNSITTAAADKITADEVIDLHDAIKDEFQNGAIWIMSPATRTYLRKLKASTGVYLLNDDISTPFGTSILGKPVYVSDNMPDYTEDGKVAIYYGDMSGLATKFSEEINIEVLREKYATQHAVGIVGWFEFDSKVENEQKIAKLVMHA